MKGRHCRDRMVVGFTTTYAASAYRHWGISCEKSRFYAKKSYFFQLRREARKCLGYFVWKITILRQKIIFFPIAEGGAKNFGVFRVKNHDFTPKNYIFSNFRGGARRVRIFTDLYLKSKRQHFRVFVYKSNLYFFFIWNCRISNSRTIWTII